MVTYQLSCNEHYAKLSFAHPSFLGICIQFFGGIPKVVKQIQFTVEKGRVLVPVGEPCPFGCRYCYTRSGEVGPARAGIDEILERLRAFAEGTDFEIIQFGYDGDPFARPERGIVMLRRLAELGKDINFSTKAFIDERTQQAIANIQDIMKVSNNTLSALVSLSCWDSASRIEPHTPTPDERIVTIKSLRSIGVPTCIAVRPILPNIQDTEYEKLVDEGLSGGCEGFILGPFYVDEQEKFARFLPSKVLKSVPSANSIVSWSAHSPLWTRYEDKDRLKRIAAMIKEKGGRVFTSSVDAIQFFRRSVIA